MKSLAIYMLPALTSKQKPLHSQLKIQRLCLHQIESSTYLGPENVIRIKAHLWQNQASIQFLAFVYKLITAR